MQNTSSLPALPSEEECSGIEALCNLRLACRFESHTDTVTCACFSPSGSLLATGSADNTIKLWLLSQEASRSPTTPYATLTAHSEGLTALSFDRRANRLVSSSLDSTVRVWRVSPPSYYYLIWTYNPRFYSLLSGEPSQSAGNSQRPR
jgi:WD40 repeat protein